MLPLYISLQSITKVFDAEKCYIQKTLIINCGYNLTLHIDIPTTTEVPHYHLDDLSRRKANYKTSIMDTHY
uniref:Uncharacterized protein n=1 Tax=Arundo donax TaxID=35708 RepID=A0A0A9AEY1_ARUDO